MKRRLLFWAALALAVAGGAYYAHVDPTFVPACRALTAKAGAAIRRLAADSETSLKQTHLYTSVTKELRERAIRETSQAGAKTAPAAPQAAPPASKAQRQSLLTVGEQIASGHAFAQHGFEFGFNTEAQMAAHIDRVIAHPFSVKRLIRGRTAYWDDDTHSVVILDPNARDGGTAFKPERGRFYFDSLR